MAAKLPDYVASAKPLPKTDRVAWYSNIAPTYAGIMLWFVFWQDVPMGAGFHPSMAGVSKYAGGTLAGGLGVAFLGLIVAALICHFLFYLVPGLLGMKTGLPLYIVGTSTYGVKGGFIMPGLVMGVLQFGWLAVNAFFAGVLLCQPWGQGPGTAAHAIVATVWAIAAAVMGLKGIQYVAKVATFFPLIPLTILIILFVKTAGGISQFDHKALVDSYSDVQVPVETTEDAPSSDVQVPVETTEDAPSSDVQVPVETTEDAPSVLKPEAALSTWQIIALIGTYVVGFFATAGAAGADIAMNSRDEKNVQMGGLIGIALATIVAGGLSLLIVAGVHGSGAAENGVAMQTSSLMSAAMGSERTAAIFMYLLAIAAFPAACFSAFIAANSFKTTMPKVNPFISVGIGTVAAIVLAITGVAGDAIGVFVIIGASFGPVCGSMAADFLLSGRKWAGPRAGVNLAGWISWVIGFAVGAADFIPGMAGKVPCPPVAAFIVGFVLYAVLAKIGLESETLEMPTADSAKA